MCRLYGFLATAETQVECTLVQSQSALLRQSEWDSLGRANAGGWGIAWYRNSVPIVELRATAAFEDETFSQTARAVSSRAIVAHVRLPSVGTSSLENTHPFRYGCWCFAHNGTIEAFECLQPRLEQETDRDLQTHRRGTTDSEQVFYWLLTRLKHHGIDMTEPHKSCAPIAGIVRDSLGDLIRMAREAGEAEPSSLNIVLTDGRNMLASRWGNSLFFLTRTGVRDCEICGMPHVGDADATSYCAAIVASEMLTRESWRGVPNGSVVLLNERSRTQILPIRLSRSVRA